MDFLLQEAGVLFQLVSGHLLLWDLLFAVIIVFFERRNPKSVWAWLLLLLFVPVLGFVLYLLVGQDFRKRKLFQLKGLEDRMSQMVRKQEHQIKNKEFRNHQSEAEDFDDLMMYNLETSGALVSDNNKIDIFTDGNEKFDALIEDMRKAEKFIHMQYYIIKNDVLFQRIAEVLKERAASGVQVRILYDGMGGRFTSAKCWKRLKEAGIESAEFFPPLFGRFQLRINYRNHRKIVVIDNKVAYVGGFNVGREYIDLDEKFGHWRDTHLRIRGNAVLGLQLRFIMDWNYCAKENLLERSELLEQADFLEKNELPMDGEGCKVQIISSGPDHPNEQIRDNYLKLISAAKKSIYIQTPYFIPDEAIFAALKVAIYSGVDVHIMIPCKPDHPFVYWATYSYIGEMVMAGAKCYTYDKGFLHSKGVIADGKAFCYGTANMDIRSFALNFEVNATVYDEEKAGEMVELFQKDLEDCTRITRDMYAGRSLWIRLREQVSRLLSPLM